jgi:hypothetical protein
MRSIKYLALAALVAFAACDEDDGGGTQVQTGTVQVTVTAGGTPAAGVTVSLGAAGTQPAQTNAQGQVTFANVAAGSYVASISGISADFACPQTSQPVVVAGGQQTSVTFACNLVQTASITGSVSNSDGTGRAGASITITRTAPAPAGTPATVATGTNGQYSLTGLRSGTYSVVLAITPNCTTVATTQNVTIAAGEARVVNFTCTVAPPPPPGQTATVAIESITQAPAAPGDPYPGCAPAGTSLTPTTLRCRINVTVGINEGDQHVSRLRLLIGTTEVYVQNFSRAQAPEGMELAEFDVTATIDVAEVTNPATGATKFNNGPTQLVAEITVLEAPTAPVHRASVPAALTNTPFFLINATSNKAPQIGEDDLLQWFDGALTVTVGRALYSSAANDQISEIALRVSGLAQIPNENTEAVRTITRDLNSGNSFSVTLSETASAFSGQNGSRGLNYMQDEELLIEVTGSTTVGGQPGPNTGAGTADAVEMRYDNRGPVVEDIFDALRATRWINEAWLFDQDDFADVGVEDDGVGLRDDYFTYQAGGDLESLATVTSGAALDETVDNGPSGNILSLTVMDGFGNSNTRFFAGVEGADDDEPDYPNDDDAFEDGVAPNPVEGASTGDMEDLDAAGDIPAFFHFGVDKGDPTIEHDTDAACGNLENMQVINFNVDGFGDGECVATEFSDELSGFDVDPVRTRIRREAPGVTGTDTCALGVIDDDDNCDVTGTSGVFNFLTDAYTSGDLSEAFYFVDDLRARDAAFNESADLEFRVVYDITDPVIFGVQHDGTLTPGGQEQFSSGVFENLDADRAEFFLVWTGPALAIRQSVTTLDNTFGPPFTRQVSATSTSSFVGSLQVGTTNAPTSTDNGAFRVTDKARNSAYGTSPALPPSPTRNFTDGGPTVAIFADSEELDATEDDLCWDLDSSDGDCTGETTSTQLSFSVQGDGSAEGDGPLANQFPSGVRFYVGLDIDNDGVIDSEGGNELWTLLGSASQTVTDDNVTDTRTYTYRHTATAAQIATAAGRTESNNCVWVRAVGYGSAGTALSPDATMCIFLFDID